MKKRYWLFCVVFLICSCGSDEISTDYNLTEEIEESMSFTTLSEAETGIDFINTITETDSFNLMFEGTIDKDGNCKVPIKN